MIDANLMRCRTRLYAELGDIETDDGEMPSVALVSWTRGIMARRSHRLPPRGVSVR